MLIQSLMQKSIHCCVIPPDKIWFTLCVVDKLKSDGRANKQLIYSETAGAMEKLAVLRAWAEVSVMATCL